MIDMKKRGLSLLLTLCMLMGLCVTGMNVLAAAPPYGYTTDSNGTELIAFRDNGGGTYDVQGYVNNSWYRSTYGNAGYRTIIVNESDGYDDWPSALSLSVTPSIVFSDQFVLLEYTLTASDDIPADTHRFGVHADTQLGSDDGVPLGFDDYINPSAIIMSADGNFAEGIQMQLRFAGLGNPYPDIAWYGYYGERTSHLRDTTWLSGPDNGTDSGLAVGWKIPAMTAGESFTVALAIGIGDAEELNRAAANTIGATGFTAGWQAVDGADYYILDVSTASDFGEGTFVNGYEGFNVGNVTEYKISGLEPNTTYYFRVMPHFPDEEPGTPISGSVKTKDGRVPEIIIYKDGELWTSGIPQITFGENGFANGTIIEYGTYDIYADGADTGVDIVVNSEGATASLYYYTLSLTAGTGISSVSGG